MNELNIDIFCCPVCKSAIKKVDEKVYCTNNECSYSINSFYKINNKSVFVDFEKSVIGLNNLQKSYGASPIKRNIAASYMRNQIRRLLNGTSTQTRMNVNKINDLLGAKSNPKILIVGGGTVGAGIDELLKKYAKSIISFDVYDSVNIDFIADGHSIPLKDDSVDLVVIQAVLEHVFDPVCVVAECYRIIKPDGYVYAETPFLQHVHEGSYDFTRFTVLGHRVLFKKFETISVGFVGGVGQSMLWSIEYFVSGLFRTRIAGKAAKAFFFWIRWLEKLIPDEWNSDGACGCYFLGQKLIQATEKKISEYLAQYDGAQK